MKNRISILLGLLLLLSSATFVSAQVVNRVEIQLNREDMIRSKNERLQSSYLIQLRDNKSMAESRMNNRVSDITQAVELSEAQNKKLKIAAKGAVGSYLQKQIEFMAQRAKTAGFEFDPDGEILANARATSARSLQARQPGVFKAVENEKIWLSSIDRILTEEQRESLETWQQARKDYREKAAVDLFVARTDTVLLLSGEQREQLREAIKERYATALASKLEKQMAGGRVTVNIRRGQNGGQQKKDDPVFSEIFSEHQLEQWNKTFDSEIRNLESQVGNQ